MSESNEIPQTYAAHRAAYIAALDKFQGVYLSAAAADATPDMLAKRLPAAHSCWDAFEAMERSARDPAEIEAVGQYRVYLENVFSTNQIPQRFLFNPFKKKTA